MNLNLNSTITYLNFLALLKHLECSFRFSILSYVHVCYFLTGTVIELYCHLIWLIPSFVLWLWYDLWPDFALFIISLVCLKWLVSSSLLNSIVILYSHLLKWVKSCCWFCTVLVFKKLTFFVHFLFSNDWYFHSMFNRCLTADLIGCSCCHSTTASRIVCTEFDLQLVSSSKLLISLQIRYGRSWLDV